MRDDKLSQIYFRGNISILDSTIKTKKTLFSPYIFNSQFQNKLPHLRGTHLKTCTSLKYIFDILVPVLISTFDHLALYEYGHDLLVDEIQVGRGA